MNKRCCQFEGLFESFVGFDSNFNGPMTFSPQFLINGAQFT